MIHYPGTYGVQKALLRLALLRKALGFRLTVFALRYHSRDSATTIGLERFTGARREDLGEVGMPAL